MEHLKHKKLYRSPNDALLFGVCSGLGRYFQIDAVFVRLAVVALAFFLHIWLGVALYIAAIFIMPIDPVQDTVKSIQEPKDVTESQEKGDSH